MVKQNHSGYNKSVESDTHYKLGKRILMTDIDCLEYVMDNGELKFVAVIDYKNENAKNVSMKYNPMQAQLKLANTLNLPMFIVITFLDREVPMYYVIPINENAKKKIERNMWMTVKTYSQFQHHLRKIKPNMEEIKDLSDVFIVYNLPRIDL